MYQEIGWLTFTFFLFIYINPHADCVGATRSISPRAAPLPLAAPAALTGIRNPAPLTRRFLLIPVVVADVLAHW